MKILCVEDDINLGRLLKATLVKHNYQVDLAEDGLAGWELAKNSAYNLILLDLLLPKIDGIRLCQLLRSGKSAESSYNRDTPIILMTALDTVTYKVMGLDAGADDYIVKPFDFEELSARIRALLRRNNNSFSQLASYDEPLSDSKNNGISYNQQKTQLLKKESKNVIDEFKDLWKQCCHSYKERLFVIQKAVAALHQGKLSLEQHHEAQVQAHTLVGSLGSFGLDKASDISRQIQNIFKQDKPLEKIKIEELKLLVTQLEYYLEPDDSITPSVVSARLLIIDNETVIAEKIATEAISWGFIAQIATNIEEIEQVLASSVVDVILLDLNFQNETAVGLAFLEKLSSQNSEIPIVVIAQEDSFATRLQVARLGIPCFLRKPLVISQVLTLVKQVSIQKYPSLYRLLVVDDDPELLKLVYKILSPYGYEVILLDQPQKFWGTLEQTNPDLLILDVEFSPTEISKHVKKLPLNGFDLCQMVRSDLRWNRLPILFLSAHTNAETMQRSFAVGANDFLSKPIVASELQTRVQTRLEQLQAWKFTEVDVLTGVSLRRKALQDLTTLLQRAQQQQQPLSLAVLDLDFFKSINDKYGHQIGDSVLIYLGQLLSQSFRAEDVIGRWGGEEFVVGMYGATGQVSRERLMQVLQKFRQHLFTTNELDLFQVTFSAGIAQFPEHGKDVQTLFQSADVTLYQAKEQGRNRVLLTATNYPNYHQRAGIDEKI